MNDRLIAPQSTTTTPLVGETDAAFAEAQPARDSRLKATNGRGYGRDTAVIPSHRSSDRSELFYASRNVLAESKVLTLGATQTTRLASSP